MSFFQDINEADLKVFLANLITEKPSEDVGEVSTHLAGRIDYAAALFFIETEFPSKAEATPSMEAFCSEGGEGKSLANLVQRSCLRE